MNTVWLDRTLFLLIFRHKWKETLQHKETFLGIVATTVTSMQYSWKVAVEPLIPNHGAASMNKGVVWGAGVTTPGTKI